MPTLQESFKIPDIRTVRGVAAPPALSKDALTFWESVFERLVKTEGWRKYLADSQSEDGYVRGPALSKLLEESLATRRTVFNDLGIKVVR